MASELPDGYCALHDRVHRCSNTSPLPRYAGCEEMHGRLRWFVPIDFFKLVNDRTGHDGGDEDGDR